ncbi:MAG TPA: hypothetical protein VN493_03560 [Thermoanaerobaculia bacterium]|nr:hypothetical protein [Thermoanaerobaculia bacterium]
MNPPTSQADHLASWQLRLGAMDANAEELQHLAPGRDKLETVLTGAQAAFQTQSSATAAKQEASRELEARIAEGRLVMAFLNAGLREHYGKESEKLKEFGLQPFRGRQPKPAKPEPPPPPLPEDVR